MPTANKVTNILKWPKKYRPCLSSCCANDKINIFIFPSKSNKFEQLWTIIYSIVYWLIALKVVKQFHMLFYQVVAFVSVVYDLANHWTKLFLYFR